MSARPAAPDPLEHLESIIRALRKHRARLARKLEALRGDLAEAERAAHYRRCAETLLVYLKQVPPRASSVRLADPADPSRTLEITLDPERSAQVNAARYFKRAAKAERGLKEVPPRLGAAEAELHALDVLLARARTVLEGASDTAVIADSELTHDAEAILTALPASVRIAIGAPAVSATSDGARSQAARPRTGRPEIPGRLQPRRLKSSEGWEVWIGRSNEGNDFLTHRLARPEDYWFHVHGAAGSHVVLRRGKGKNEPSKQTIEEISGWAAFYSQARTAGKVPVIVTRKKYVRKPRKAPPGLAVCEREKTVMVRPAEPERTSLAEESG